MDLNLTKEVRFFSGNEFKDIRHVAEGIVWPDKDANSDHWGRFSVYLISLSVVCLAFGHFVRGKPFDVRISELKSVLDLPVDDIREFLLMNSITVPLSVYLSADDFKEASFMLKDFMNAKPVESCSIVKSARDFLDAFMASYNIVLESES